MTVRKRRVLVLMHEHLVPPESLEGYTDKEINEWATEYDVLAGLQKLGHDVYQLAVGDDIHVIRDAITEIKPHIVCNQLVHFHGIAQYDQHVVSYLELLRQPYTGCNPRGLTLCRDKALSKMLLAFHGVVVPKFAVYPLKQQITPPEGLKYPMVVKSVAEEASLGITQASVVSNEQRLKERIEFMRDSYAVDVIVEEYIHGRELYVGVIGNRRLITYPVWELPFENLGEGALPIATERLKWDVNFQKRHKIETQRARDLSPALDRRIARMCKQIYRVLGISGYARIDLRLAEDGTVFVLEANPNPDLKFGEDFAESAEAYGHDYCELLERILQLGMSYSVEQQRRAKA